VGQSSFSQPLNKLPRTVSSATHVNHLSSVCLASIIYLLSLLTTSARHRDEEEDYSVAASRWQRMDTPPGLFNTSDAFEGVLFPWIQILCTHPHHCFGHATFRKCMMAVSLLIDRLTLSL